MPKIIPYHLSFTNGYHVGQGGVESISESLVGIPSDTLFAALLDAWHHIGGRVEDLLSSENAEPAFRTTSAFPFAGGARFYPMPVDISTIFEQSTLEDFDWNKPLKKVRYLSESLLLKALSGEKLDSWLFPKNEHDEPKNGIALQNGAAWLTREDVKQLPESIRCVEDEKTKVLKDRPLSALYYQSVWKSHNAPRVSLDRISSAPNLFQAERVLFAKGCGLWFGAIGQTDKLSRALNFLGESGLGGERSVGYGSFTFKIKSEMSFDDPQEYAYLLSRYHPHNDEEIKALKDNSAYRLESVGGWLRSSDGKPAQRRKQIWMVAEGSRIKGNPQGNALDVRPEYEGTSGISHPVFRAGFAIGLNWKDKR